MLANLLARTQAPRLNGTCVPAFDLVPDELIAGNGRHARTARAAGEPAAAACQLDGAPR
jgi:hypothetical protein